MQTFIAVFSQSQENFDDVWVTLLVALLFVWGLYLLFFRKLVLPTKRLSVDAEFESKKQKELCEKRDVPWDASQIKVVHTPKGHISTGKVAMQERLAGR
jgi:hypothetical protein